MDKNGSCGNPGTATNNSINMMNNDYDDINGTIDNGATTINSSAAYLAIPAGKTVLWAGLTWQGYMVDKTAQQKEAGHTIKYKYANDTYQSVTNAQMNWVYFNASRFYYQGFVDITNYVNAHKGGYYWVGDIATTEGKPAGGSFGAWSITVVYQDFNEDFRNISVYSGYQAFASTNDINNAITYASNNGCDISNTGVENHVSSTLSGFLTPKSGTVNSSLVVFAGEGDIGLTGDSGTLSDINGVEHFLSNSLNPSTNIMNATISKNGQTVTSGLPYYSANTLGADIDTFDTSGILSNKQTSTNIKFSTSGDGYMPGLYALQTKLYVPKFCYDYAYSQDGIYFTEDNNGSNNPKLSTDKLPEKAIINSPIQVKIYLRNLIDSDISIHDMNISVLDINTTQATYIRNSSQLNFMDNVSVNTIYDSFLNIDNSYIKNIVIGDISSNEYFYLYYQLNPKTSTLNMPINILANYELKIGSQYIPYTTKLGANNIQMCSSKNFKYQPDNGIFNVVDNNYINNNLSSGFYYNLPTQVVLREGNFSVIHLEGQTDILNNKSYATYVYVDMIDASAFHDTNASCYEPSSSISPKVLVKFEDNQSISKLTSTDANFYKNARENVAFRVSYNVVDNNGTLLKIDTLTNGDVKLLNFPIFGGEKCNPSFGNGHETVLHKI